MEFRRVDRLPPYAFAEIDRVKAEERRAGRDVVDLAFGNPDLPSPPIAVEKLRQLRWAMRFFEFAAGCWLLLIVVLVVRSFLPW